MIDFIAQEFSTATALDHVVIAIMLVLFIFFMFRSIFKSNRD